MPVSSLFGWEWPTGLLIHGLFLTLGQAIVLAHTDRSATEGRLCNLPQKVLIARVDTEPVKKPHSLKCLATIRFLYLADRCLRQNERILMYFKTEQADSRLRPGSIILFNQPLQEIENMVSPDGFDYKAYCQLRHIDAQIFLSSPDYQIIDTETAGFFSGRLDSWRQKLLAIIRLYIPGKMENGLMEALMIGFTADLDRDLLQSYSDAGVVHIIAISGLHLALIHHLLQRMLRRIKDRKTGRWIKLILLLAALWLFSLIAGAGASVIRSAVMFSMLLLSRNLSREPVIYNALASSAVLLLCFDPFWLWDVGFQLSYLAVLSLVIFSKPIQKLLPVKNKLLASLWNAMAVSIAAQILTVPLTIYYFHRFPNYFLVANLLAVPLSSGILTGGILLCLFSFSPFIAGCLGNMLGRAVGFLNDFVRYCARLPGAVTDHLFINSAQVVALYVIIWCLWRLVRRADFPTGSSLVRSADKRVPPL